MQPKQNIPQKGIAVWILKKIGFIPTQVNVLVLRLIIISVCIVGIYITNSDRKDASEFGNYDQVSAEYPELFE